MPAVLVDTGPLYAASIASDTHHELARSQMQLLSTEGISVIVPYPILLEAYTLILRRTWPASAQAWLSSTTEGLGLINPMEEDYSSALELLHRYPDQPFTLFDAVLAVLSAWLNMPVWTYDHHFDVMRVAVWR